MFLVCSVTRIVDDFVHGLGVIEVVFLREVEGRRGGVDCVGGFVVHFGRLAEIRVAKGGKLGRR
tara:strand:- start:380 stop:571 length:192 start_codon:yes stop_codon:yes gene_type:complete